MPEREYTGTPLTTKLGAKPGAAVVVFFTTSSAELAKRFAKLKRSLGPADGLWIAWPKKASKLDTDLDFETVQRIGLDGGSPTTRASPWTPTGKPCASSTGSARDLRRARPALVVAPDAVGVDAPGL